MLISLFLAGIAAAQPVTIKDVYPEKSRYVPEELIRLEIELAGTPQPGDSLAGLIMDRDQKVGTCGPVTLTTQTQTSLLLPCSAPSTDFRGYLVTIELRSADGKPRQSAETAIDISSDWKRFPRYGYLAHYNAEDVPDPAAWIRQLNKYHIDGLQFYDFQYRHDQPLAGTVAQPASKWKDIAGREIDGGIVQDFIRQAHSRNMMAMAYDASYSAYDDVFARAHPLPLQWATWASSGGPRNAETAKSLPFDHAGWSTSKLFYMNQNDRGWQDYLCGQMRNLFMVYPFDGWHIDTFGEKNAFAFDGSPVDYIAGFRSYIDHASAALHKSILLNAVNTWGQEYIANSAADFVYSELWEDHETFASILGSAEQVHDANPAKAYVIAAYVHRHEDKTYRSDAKYFNPPSVLLTDATIFASGAAHIELGDGGRMLSSEYFPADTRLAVSPELARSLRHYYDFLTAYECYLRDGLTPAEVSVSIDKTQVDPLGVPNTVWSISRQRGAMTMVHLINLLGSDDPHWRDVTISRPDAPHLRDLHVKLVLLKPVHSIGWASPDEDGGRFQTLQFTQRPNGLGSEVDLVIPALHYWDTIFIE